MSNESTNSSLLDIQKLFTEFQNVMIGEVKKSYENVENKLKDYDATIKSLQSKVDQTLQRVCEMQSQIGCEDTLPFSVRYDITLPIECEEQFHDLNNKLKDNVAMVKDLQKNFSSLFSAEASVTVNATKCLRMLFCKQFAVEKVTMAQKVKNKIVFRDTTVGVSLLKLLITKYEESNQNYAYHIMSSFVGESLSKASD